MKLLKKHVNPHFNAPYSFHGKSFIQHFILLVLLVVAILFTTPAHAQDKAAEVDKIFSWATQETPGCACAVSQNGKTVVSRAYGSADLERNAPITASTIFDIGSVRKQFIAAAVLLLVEEKTLSLQEDVHAYIPEFPNYGQKITLDHLLTHTSGLRDWTGMLPLANGKPDALTLILRQRGLNFKPGDEWSYSNSGYVLLTEIVTRKTGMPFAEFMRKRLFEPLGLQSTSYVVDMTNVVKNRAMAYEKQKDGSYKLDMYWGNDRGGGAILSTAHDLVLWNNALKNNRLGTFVSDKLQEPAQLNNGRKLGYARGLFLENFRGVKEVWHSGGAAGYHAWLGSFPEQNLSIAVVCNSDAKPATGLAERIADLYVSYKAPQDLAAGPPPVLTGDTLLEAKSKAGLFFQEQTGEAIRLALDRDRLRIAGGPGLVPKTKNRFKRHGAFVQYMSQDQFEINFLSPDQFELTTMEGKKSKYLRAASYTPSTADLQALSGRYTSEELGAFFDISAGKEGLTGKANDATGPGLSLTPIQRDTYQLAGVTVRFVRDKAGKVVALDYGNPVVRNIRFTKVRDLTSRR